MWPSVFQLLPHSYTLTHAYALGLEDYGYYYSVDKGSAAHEEGLGFGTLERTHLKAQKCVVATYNPTSKEIETVPGARWLARLIRAGKVWAQGETMPQ